MIGQRIIAVVALMMLACWQGGATTGIFVANADEPTLSAAELLRILHAEQHLVVHDGLLMPQALATHLKECPRETFVTYPEIIQLPDKPLKVLWLGMGPGLTSGDQYRFVKREEFAFLRMTEGAEMALSYEVWNRGTQNWNEEVSFDTRNDGQPFAFRVMSRQPSAPALTIDDLLNQWDSGLYLQKEFTPILRLLGPYKPSIMGYSVPTSPHTDKYSISLNLSRSQADSATQSLQNLCRDKRIPFALDYGNYDRRLIPADRRPPLDVTVTRIDREQEMSELCIRLITPPVPRGVAPVD